MSWFLYGRSKGAALVRTIVELVLGYLLSELATIFNLIPMNESIKSLVMGLVAIIITAVLGFIRDNKGEE